MSLARTALFPTYPSFWEELATHGEAPALIDADSGEVWNYRRLSHVLKVVAAQLDSRARQLILVAADNDVGAVLYYLAALSAGHVVYVCGGGLNALSPALIERYAPDIIIGKRAPAAAIPLSGYENTRSQFGYDVLRSPGRYGPVEAGIALLLSTSGSTGSSKLVRLSGRNVAASTCQVREALLIQPEDRAITSLPVSFVYGLSVVHSHLAAGASIVVTGRSVVDHLFWKAVRDWQVTSLAGVTWTYQTLRQMRFERKVPPSLRKLTHSGGKVDSALTAWLTDDMAALGMQMYFMYGQTEATGRISVLPPSMAASKRGAVGWPVLDGKIQCSPEREIIYSGPNVMLGYCTCRDDLVGTDEMRGTLSTGDIGFVDGDGCLFITGRASRLCKLLGQRVNLDEIESFLRETEDVAVTSDDNVLEIFAARELSATFPDRIEKHATQLGVPQHKIVTHTIRNLPRTDSGKIRYQDLHTLIEYEA